MFSPSDSETEARMLKSRDDAAFAFGVQPLDGTTVWGWRARTVGCEVDAHEGRDWGSSLARSAHSAQPDG